MIDKGYFAHTEPGGRTFSECANDFGYPAHAENIIAGPASGATAFCGWKSSPGHNTNMLRPNHRTTGIGGVAGGGSGFYWSSNFGPNVVDTISEPLTEVPGCSMPTSLPNCN